MQNLAAKSQLNISEIMFDSLPLKQKNLFIKNSEQIKSMSKMLLYNKFICVTIAARAGCFFLGKEAIWNENKQGDPEAHALALELELFTRKPEYLCPADQRMSIPISA